MIISEVIEYKTMEKLDAEKKSTSICPYLGLAILAGLFAWRRADVKFLEQWVKLLWVHGIVWAKFVEEALDKRLWRR